jgi:hypothetical protein
MDDQENKDCRRTLREIIHLMKFPNFVSLICCVIDFLTSIIQGATDQ